MALEIRELHIKVNVSEPAGAGRGPGAGSPPPGQPGGAEDKAKLIADCVDEVMHLLNVRKER